LATQSALVVPSSNITAVNNASPAHTVAGQHVCIPRLRHRTRCGQPIKFNDCVVAGPNHVGTHLNSRMTLNL